MSADLARVVVAAFEAADESTRADLLRCLGLRPAAPTPGGDGDALLTLAEAARRLAIHPKTCGQWARAGRLKGAVRVGRAWRVPPAALDAVIDAPREVGASSRGSANRSTSPARRGRAARLPLASGPGDAGTSRGLDDRRRRATAVREATSHHEDAGASVLPLRQRPR